MVWFGTRFHAKISSPLASLRIERMREPKWADVSAFDMGTRTQTLIASEHTHARAANVHITDKHAILIINTQSGWLTQHIVTKIITLQRLARCMKHLDVLGVTGHKQVVELVKRKKGQVVFANVFRHKPTKKFALHTEHLHMHSTITMRGEQGEKETHKNGNAHLNNVIDARGMDVVRDENFSSRADSDAGKRVGKLTIRQMGECIGRAADAADKCSVGRKHLNALRGAVEDKKLTVPVCGQRGRQTP